MKTKEAVNTDAIPLTLKVHKVVFDMNKQNKQYFVFYCRHNSADQQSDGVCRGGSRLPAVNYYHKTLHLGCCSSPRSTSGMCPLHQGTFLKGGMVTMINL